MTLPKEPSSLEKAKRERYKYSVVFHRAKASPVDCHTIKVTICNGITGLGPEPKDELVLAENMGKVEGIINRKIPVLEGTYSRRLRLPPHLKRQAEVDDRIEEIRLYLAHPMVVTGNSSFWMGIDVKNACRVAKEISGRVCIGKNSYRCIPLVKEKLGTKFVLCHGDDQFYVEGNYLIYDPEKVKDLLRRKKKCEKRLKTTGHYYRLNKQDQVSIARMVIRSIEFASNVELFKELNRIVRKDQLKAYPKEFADTLPAAIDIDDPNFSSSSVNRRLLSKFLNPYSEKKGRLDPLGAYSLHKPFLKIMNPKSSNFNSTLGYLELIGLFKLLKRVQGDYTLRPYHVDKSMVKFMERIKKKLWGMCRRKGKVYGEKVLSRMIRKGFKSIEESDKYKRVAKREEAEYSLKSVRSSEPIKIKIDVFN